MTESGDTITQDNEMTVAEQMPRRSDTDEMMAVDRSQNELELEELKVCDRVLKSVKEIEILLVAEVAKHWRSVDPKRASFEEVATRATQHTIGLVLDLKEKCVARRDEREVYKGVATTLGCYSQEQFVRKVEELVNSSLVVSDVKEAMGWKKHEIVDNCITLKEEIAQLQAKLEAQQREIEELRLQARRAERVEHRVAVSMDDTVPGKATTAKQKYSDLAQDYRTKVLVDRDTFQSGLEERLRAKASSSGMGTKPCGKMPLSRGQSKFSHCESDLSEDEYRNDLINSDRDGRYVETRNDNMSAYLKYIALPEVRVFTGCDIDYPWESFQETFMLKYPRDCWSDRELRTLLKTKLSGNAKAQYEALPRELRRGTFEKVMRAMSEAYRGEAQTKRIVALGKLRRLKKQESQSVAEFCVELERLSAIAYPELDELALATTRAQQLYEQLVHWPESYHLLVAMEETGVDVYANLKDTAMRMERRKLTLRNAKDLGESSGFEMRRVASKFVRAREGGFDKAQHSVRPAQVAKEHPSRDAEGGQQDNKRELKMRCYRCQGIGHLARNCKAGNTHVGSKATGVVLEERVPCRAERKDVVPTEEGTIHPACPAPAPFGKKHMTTVEIGTKAWRALLDTGSEISIMPITVFNHAKENGQVRKEWPVDRTKNVFDASGNRMKFETVVEVAVKENGLKETIISMHISKQKGQTLIIGTNALPLLGYDLVCQRESSETKAPKASSSGGDGNDSGEALSKKETEFAINSADKESKAVVSKRAYVAPGEVKWISIKGATRPGDIPFYSRFAGIRSGICCVNESGEAHIQVCNYTQEPLVLRVGQEVGHYEQEDVEYIPVKTEEAATDMLVLGKPALQESVRKQLLDQFLKANREGHDQDEPELWGLVAEYDKVFAVEDRELTQTNLVIHEVDTGSTPPIRQKLRPVPLGLRKEFKGMIKELLDRGIIEASQSEWASPVVLVRKKDGSLRLCIDYRELNKNTKQDAYPLPQIDIILHSLRDRRYFSTLDMASGYWQIPLSDDAKTKSAFVTPEGLYQFKVLPFGLCTSPARFQRLMDTVLGELLGKDVFVYIDDVLIATDTKERHIEILRAVLEAMSKANLKLKPQKCMLLGEKVAFLGHEVDKEGVHADPAKIEKIQNYPQPTCLAEMRTFLGLCGYYRKFVLGFSSIAQPLFELTSSKSPWQWQSAHEEAFQELKARLTRPPVLAQPDIETARSGERPFILYTDASRVGVGAVLSQEGHDGFLHPIYFVSKKLSRAERNYHITDLEALAIVIALRKLHYFVYGMHVVVRTDHSPLTVLFKRQNVSARVLRWALEVQQYKLSIEHVKGKANAVADALSRGIPTEAKADEISSPGEDKIVCSVHEAERPDWLKELENDKDYRTIIESLRANNLDEEVKLPGMTNRLRVADFVIEEGVLKLLQEDGTAVLVVPKSERKKMFDEAHKGCLAGHFSAKKMCRILKKSVFWESMEKDVAKWVRACRECFLSNPRPTNTPPLKPFVASRPFDCVCADILEMGLSTSGMKYVLVLVDHFSKWLGAYPMKDKGAASVAQVIFQRWVCEGGRWPRQLHTDQGTEFVNEIISELTKISGIEHTVTKGYNSRENGAAERAIGTLQRILKKKIEFPEMWDVILPNAVFAYNVTPHAATGESPFFLLYGFDPVIPLNGLPESRVRLSQIDLDDYKTELIRGLRVIREVCQQTEKYRERMKKYYDDKRNVSASYLFKGGERVFMKMPRERNRAKYPKLVCEWDGPYGVIEVSENSALITKIGVNEDPVRVQFDLLIKCPEEIPDEPIRSNTKRKKGRKLRVAKETVMCKAMTSCIDASFRLEDAYDVNDDMHFLHMLFKCDGQNFPQMCGRNGFPLAGCRVSQNTFVRDLLPVVPQPAADERLECILDAARVLAIWWGTGSISAKVQRICDKSYLAITPKSVGTAYAFFRSRCTHVAIMTSMVPVGAKFSHAMLKGWPWDITRIVEYGWNISRKMEWTTVAEEVGKTSEHGRVVVIIPEVVRRLTFCLKGPRTTLFYYRSFREIKRSNNILFADEVGNAVLVLPPKEPDDPYSWIPFVGAVDLWMRCGAHVWMVNGPRFEEDGTWSRMNLKARTHVLGYLDNHPDFAVQWHDLVPAEAGVVKVSMACLRVGVVKDLRRWWAVEQALEFYTHLSNQLNAHGLDLEPIRMPKSIKSSGTPAKQGRGQGSSGKPAIMDGRISKRHLKRKEKRHQRSLERAAEHAFSKIELGRAGDSSL